MSETRNPLFPQQESQNQIFWFFPLKFYDGETSSNS